MARFGFVTLQILARAPERRKSGGIKPDQGPTHTRLPGLPEGFT